MRRWMLDLGAVAILVAGAVIFSVVNFGWPNHWASVFSVPAGIGAFKYILLATVFIPFRVRAWAGRDSYSDRGGDAFMLLGLNLAMVAAVAWLVAALPRTVLLATIVIGIQAVFTYQAWRRARRLRPR
jgi:hypothetical protein